MMRFSAIVAALMVGAAFACGARAPAAQAPVPPPTAVAAAKGLVFMSGGGKIEVLDVASGQVVRELPEGTPSPDWRWIYTAGQGRLQQVDTATGQASASKAVPDWAQAVRPSGDGAWLVLSGPPSRFEVIDAAFEKNPIPVNLNGRFTFDGLSNDGRRLYLLEWVSAGRYQVRMYDLAAGRLAPQVIADKTEIGQLMSGEALTSLTSADGALQLTLYQRSAKNEAFVHVLPIGRADPFAFCKDLPAPASGWGFVPGPDGRNFYAVNPPAGIAVKFVQQGPAAPAMQEGRLGVRGGSPAGGEAPAAVVSPDGATLLMSTWPGVVSVDTHTMKVTGRFLDGERISGMAFAPDGAILYALSQDSRLLQLDPRSMSGVSEVSLSGVGAILHTT